MTLATLTPSDKTTFASPQIVAARESVQRIDEFAAQLKTMVQSAAQNSESFDQTERSVRDIVRKMGKQAIEFFIQLQGDGDLGESITTHDGSATKRIHPSDNDPIDLRHSQL